MNINEEFNYRIDSDKGYDNEKLANDLIGIAKKHLTKQFDTSGVVGSMPASKDEALRKRKVLADKYYRNDPCESAFALGFINCYEWLERILNK